ncbi:MAG: exodeoxyribonuclease VII small subunit [Clostridia bacterium]|nr:exodeoxyribonuclease VII small subunit [Clostridia bacterium]
MAKGKETINFEDALEKLESFVSLLKSNDISLEKSVEVYEKCIMYHKICADILENVKQKIEIYNPQSGTVESFGDENHGCRI